MQEQWEWEWKTDYLLEAIRSWLQNWKRYNTSSPKILSVRECDGSAGLEIYNDTGTKRFRRPVGN
jgi:hypothetical protein